MGWIISCTYILKVNTKQNWIKKYLTKLKTYQNLIWYSFFTILYNNLSFCKVLFIHLSSYIANIFTTYSLYYSNNSIKQAVVFCSNWVNDTQKWIVTIDTFARRTKLGRTPKKSVERIELSKWLEPILHCKNLVLFTANFHR